MYTICAKTFIGLTGLYIAYNCFRDQQCASPLKTPLHSKTIGHTINIPCFRVIQDVQEIYSHINTLAKLFVSYYCRTLINTIININGTFLIFALV